MRQSHLILSNASVMWVTQVLKLVPQLIFVPYLIGTVGEVGYGAYALVWSLLVSIDQMERSLQSGVVKYSAAFLAQGQIDNVNKVASSSFVYSIILSVIACAGIILAGGFYNDPSGQIGIALVVVGIMVLFIFPLTPYVSVIQSRQFYYVGAVADTLSKYLSLLVIIAWFSFVNPSVEALIIIMAVMLFLSRLIQAPIAHYFVPGLVNSPRLFDRESFHLIASFGAATVLASLCLAVNSTGIRWLMDALVSTKFIAHLAIMLMPGMLLSQVIGAMTITIMPAASAYEATGNHGMLQELLIRGMRYMAIISLGGLTAAGLLMQNVLKVWVGPGYMYLAPYALALFAGEAFMQSSSISHHMLKGIGRLRAVVFIYFIGLVIVPVGLIFAIFNIWHNPYVAVTAGLIAGQLVSGSLNIGFCTKAVRADLSRVFLRVYAQPLAVAALVWLPVVGIVTFSGFDGLIARALISVIAVLLFFSSCYFFIATPVEKKQAVEMMHMIINKTTSFFKNRTKIKTAER
jgi:O-antigen/teichoic acid export membrane protein